MTSTDQDHPHVIALPPLIFLAGLITGFGLHWLSNLRLPRPLPLTIAGAVFVVAAGVIASSASRVMKKAGTNIRPNKPTTAIVTGGPYRFTRNPMYLSLCLLNIGFALLAGGLIPLAMTLVLASILHFGVILREEKYLAAKFGSAYLNYCSRVRRWL